MYLYKTCRCALLIAVSALLLSISVSIDLPAQTSVADTVQIGDRLQIDTILIIGNRRTKAKVILHELDFSPGDSIAEGGLAARLEHNRLRVLNLGLFTDACIEILKKTPEHHITLLIEVKESWYTYPVPLFELADRNFNVWWNEYNRTLKRVNYGINWYQLNLTGHADILRINANFGYSNRYEITYSNPYANKTQTLGIQSGISFTRAHEVALTTTDNKLDFRNDPSTWQIESLNANAGVVWRPGLFLSQTFVLEFHRNRIIDSIATHLNPDFFLGGRTTQQHFSLVYHLRNDHRDIRPYPTKGWMSKFELRWNGLLPSDDLHLLRLRAEWQQYFNLSPRFSLGAIAVGRFSLPHKKPPYFNNQAIGYGADYISGYEYFVADGLDFGLLKSAVHWKLLDKTFNLSRIMPLASYKQFPARVYLTLNNDMGYARDDFYAVGNPLANRLLWGYGLSIDIVAYYDKVIRINWSWNDLGQNGLFLHFDTGF